MARLASRRSTQCTAGVSHWLDRPDSLSRGAGVQTPQTRAHARPSGPIVCGSGLPWHTRHSLGSVIRSVIAPTGRDALGLRRRGYEAVADVAHAARATAGRTTDHKREGAGRIALPVAAWTPRSAVRASGVRHPPRLPGLVLGICYEHFDTEHEPQNRFSAGHSRGKTPLLPNKTSRERGALIPPPVYPESAFIGRSTGSPRR
jgi:hypothetical protein